MAQSVRQKQKAPVDKNTRDHAEEDQIQVDTPLEEVTAERDQLKDQLCAPWPKRKICAAAPSGRCSRPGNMATPALHATS